MKNGCNETLEATIAERDERAKKLYRYVNDVARRIGEATGNSRTLADLFSIHIEVQRQKLRDNCEKLLFLDPINYGKKALELLWRKVYYDTISTAKKLRETDESDDYNLFTHLICGIGNFHNFMAKLQSEMGLELKDLDYMLLQHNEEDPVASPVLSEDELQFGRAALHSCLIYLGDLSRYQVEIFHSFDPSIAARYYLQAAHLDTVSGMPYNQLGNLYLDRNYNLDSVCYYIQCLNCRAPFEGAMGNLIKIFEKNSQYVDAAPLSQFEHIQNTVNNFLALIEIWYLGKNDNNIAQRCNKIAHEIKICMEFMKSPLPDINKNYKEYIQALEEENINPSFMNSNVIHKITLICLFTISKMVETDDTKAFACKAFTLALLSQLLQKMLRQLEMLGLSNPAHKPKAVNTLIIETIKHPEENTKLPEMESSNELQNGLNDILKEDKPCIENKKNEEANDGVVNGEVKNKKTPLKRRRRRRIASSESSDMSDVDTESSEIEVYESSSDEDLTNSSCQSEDESHSQGSNCECSDADDIANGDVIHNVETEVKEENGDIKLTEVTDKLTNGSKTSKNIDKKSNMNIAKFNNINKENRLDLQKLQEFLLGDNFLASIKLLQDWVLLEKELILSCGESGESLFQCIVDLLNMFTHYFTLKTDISETDYPILTYARHVAKNLRLEYKTIPLPEDINLRGTNICKFDKDAAEWQNLERHNLSVYEENIIRILNFIDFGQQIAKIVPRIRYNRSIKIYYLKRNPQPKLGTKINYKKSREWHNSKQPHQADGVDGEGGLLARMGRLWLAARVRELERGGAAPAPALLALDASALHSHLRRVKQLIRTKNFVVLIPAVVLHELDGLKREMSSARDAIRWLEMQLKSGCRFLRAQRADQSKPLPLIKYPRKAPPQVHNFIQMLEFCYHFVADDKQAGDGDAHKGKSAPMLVLLVGTELISDEYKEFSVKGAAAAAGITVEHIEDFYARWRHASHKNGKKS